jgi:fatty acid amide hydrolase 2
MVDLWFAALDSLGDKPLTELLATEGSISLSREFLLSALRRPNFSFPILGFAALQKFTPRTPARLEKALSRIKDLQREFRHRIGAGILLLPPHPRPAPKHRRALLHPFAFAYTAAFNVLRVPATVAPVAKTAGGLPVCVQIVGSRGNDHVTIAAALALEENFGVRGVGPLNAQQQSR